MSGILLGVLLPFCLFATGLYFMMRVGLPMLRHPIKAVKGAWHAGGAGGTSPAAALAVALAGTLGVGNIAGVATAMVLGGPGAVFWMWVAAFLAMPLKYAEITLACATRQWDKEGRPHGGAMYYIKESFGGKWGRALAVLFALLLLLSNLTLGTMLQTTAAAEALSAVLPVRPWLVGAVIGAAVLFILLKGAKGVERVCATLVPLACLFFCVLALAVLWLRRERIPAAFAQIFQAAFTPKSGAGGIAGVLTSGALRYGVARGLVSNEAGCGTAPTAHAASAAKTPAQQGFWGILEVFVDTVLLCTLTALVLLLGGYTGAGGVEDALLAFGNVLGAAAPPLVAVSVAVFAFATVLCWSHYGTRAVGYLALGKKGKTALFLFIAAACVVGAVVTPGFVWSLTDAVLALMTVLNLAALFASRHRIRRETELFFQSEQAPAGK